MYSAENYMWGWVAYSTGGLCLLFCLWLLVRKVGVKAIRHIILLLAAVVLFTPVTAYRDDPHLAPAFFVSLYEGLLASGDDLGFQRGLAPILAISFVAIIFYGLLRLLLSRFRKKPLPADERSDQISGDFNVALEEELKTESKAVVPKKAVSKKAVSKKAVSKKAVPKKAVSKKAVPKKAPIKK
jgi:hypothetical protein